MVDTGIDHLAHVVLENRFRDQDERQERIMANPLFANSLDDFTGIPPGQFVVDHDHVDIAPPRTRPFTGGKL